MLRNDLEKFSFAPFASIMIIILVLINLIISSDVLLSLQLLNVALIIFQWGFSYLIKCTYTENLCYFILISRRLKDLYLFCKLYKPQWCIWEFDIPLKFLDSLSRWIHLFNPVIYEIFIQGRPDEITAVLHRSVSCWDAELMMTHDLV